MVSTDEFLNSYVQSKVYSCVEGIEKLSEIAVTQPQAAYSAFSMYSGQICIARMVPNSYERCSSLDEVLALRFLPALDWSTSI